MSPPRACRYPLAVFLTLAGVGPVSAQQSTTELKPLYTKLTATHAVSIDEGKAALEKIAGWKLNTSLLSPAENAQLLGCQIYASLAAGDARAAANYVAELQVLRPEAPESSEAAYVVALTTGDGKLGTVAINKMIASADAPRKIDLSEKLRRVKMIGVKAPAEVVKTEDGVSISFADRGGQPLVVFLWNLRKKPDNAQIAAMRQQYDSLKADSRVEFLGVSANLATQASEATVFARSNEMNWKHHFENKSAGAPITHKAFKAGAAPTQIVIDGDGVVRAYGDIGELGIEYAVRAVAAEAGTGAIPPVSRSADGKEVDRDSKPVERKHPPAAKAGEDKSAEKPKSEKSAEKPKSEKSGELRNDAEAESKLREARLAMRTGQHTRAKEILKEIIANYPGTVQARDAQERLDSMP